MSHARDKLPKEFADYIHATLKKYDDKNPNEISLKARIERVLTNPQMQEAYFKLLKQNADVILLTGYNDKIRLHDSITGFNPDKFEVPNNAKQRKAFLKIEKYCQGILDAFAELGSQDNKNEAELDIQDNREMANRKLKATYSGFYLLAQSVNRAVNKAIKTSDMVGHTQYHLIHSLIEEIGQSDADILQVINLLKNTCIAAKAAPKMPLPTKLEMKRPDIQDLATDLSAYLRMHYKKPFHEVVATTVNIALNLDKKSITADWVRKLAKP